jgi:hypothetical protein
MQPPNYFNEIQRRASARWDQLECDPELAGPWHQLFGQVTQSPRYVVSELLQNADDAGAKSASVRIEDNTFIFEHDGDDFDAQQFASLCRFGFSNKRTLHTIGFRGVGFKSTFSLGSAVEVHTPTLAVCFKKKRFTDPVWMPDAKPTLGTTVIRVRITDKNRASALRKNFQEWTKSPASLLFFNNLKELSIEEQVITRQPFGKGPATDSSWVKLIGAVAQKVLVAHSEALPFPNEAADEIYAERGVSADELQLPPCRVEIVLGLSEAKRLYVVLPTGAELNLPFSCNAPFIQDAARFAIKDPATSPTNRWLLERAGRLAGKVLLQWLGNDDLPLKNRAAAYDLLKSAAQFAPGLNGACSQIIMENMLAELDGQRLVLTTEGKLAKTDECVSVPDELFSVWEPAQLLKLFAADSNHLLAPEVSDAGRSALKSHGWLANVDSEQVLQRLEQSDHVPQPASWQQLHALWSFVQNEINYDWSNERRRRMKVVPVDGGKGLHAANDVVRLSSRRDLLSADDWKFVMNYAPTLNAEWLAWVSKRAPRRTAPLPEETDPSYNLLQALSLHEPSPVDKIVAQASLRIFAGKKPALVDCVRIAHIMAALGASLPDGFCFATKDLCLRQSDHGIVVDETGRVEDIVPASWAKEHLLHEDYSRNFIACKPEAWKQWIRTSGSGLLLFVPIARKKQRFYSRSSVIQFAADRGGQKPEQFHYERSDFTVVDFGFPPELARHWETLAKNDAAIWAAVMEGILTAPWHHWKDKIETDIRHNGRTYYRSLDCGFIPAEWIIQMRSLACLPDSHGKFHLPAELLLRTPDTETLIGVESFVRAELDTEATKPLLKLLNVRDTPTGADKLLGRLHALSSVTQPTNHLPQISRLYEALDRIAVRCASVDLKPIIESFNRRAIILTDGGEWMTSGEVCIFPGEDNNCPTVHASLRNLALWPRIGVSERPALERTIEWLKSLESGARLDATATKRVRAALQRDPVRIWNECRHWLTLDSTWERVESLKFRITMQSLTKWGELFPAIKSATANLQMLSVDVTQLHPFTVIRNLGDAIEFRVTRIVESPDKGGQRTWLTKLAEGLCRVKLPNDEDTKRVKTAAQRLRQTAWRAFVYLDVTPYVEGAPAGELFTPKALWQDTNLYVASLSTARLHKELADELVRPFSHPQISDAIAACIDRTTEFISDYLEAHFDLDAQPELPAQATEAAKDTESVPTEPALAATKDSIPKDGADGADGADAAAAVDGETAAGADDGGADDHHCDDHEEEQEMSERKEEPKPPKPSLIEIYARQQGFHKHPTEKCFTHPDGRRIQKSESPFNWEEHNANGKLISRFWVTEQKLANGVEIGADLWALFCQQPDATTLVVIGENHTPYAVTGQELLELKDSRQITLHPSRFRIVETA